MFSFLRPGGSTFDCRKDIPPQTGRVILITGGNSGLGLQSAYEFARHLPDHIYVSARTVKKAQVAIKIISDRLVADNIAPPTISPLVLDLASLTSVREAAAKFLAAETRLDILMLNAGIMATPPGLTSDGYEIQFGTNHVGHALLTKLLLPLLLQTADGPTPGASDPVPAATTTTEASSGDDKNQGQEQQQPEVARDKKADVRVIILSSGAVSLAPSGGIQFDTLKTTAERLASWVRYGQSKLANALFARELAARYPSLTVAAVHPGAVATNLANPIMANNMLARILIPLAKVAVANVENGVRNQMWASVSSDVVSGEYYVPVAVSGAGPPALKDGDALGKRLWEWTEKELEGFKV